VLRRLTIVALAVAAVWTSAPLAVAEDPAEPPVKRTVSLDVARNGMAVVPVAYRITVSPARAVPRLRAAIQVRADRGWVTLRTATPDRRGLTTGSIVSNRPGQKQYRAVLFTPKGRVAVASAVTSVEWSPLEHRITLDCVRPSAPVGIDIPCTMVVDPAAHLDDMIAVLQVRSRSNWLFVEAIRVPDDGRARTHVSGLAGGNAEYRAVLMRDARIRAESTIVTITHTVDD
jgi:hypothetical protein